MLESAILSFPKIDQVILFGGGTTCRYLIDFIQNSDKSVKVVTSPRHAAEVMGCVSFAEFLSNSGIDFRIIEKIDEGELGNFLGNLENSLCLSLGAAWVFSKSLILNVFSNRLLNSHGTRLPQNRGGGGFSWQVLTANRFGFATLHVVEPGIDTGPIVKQHEFIYPASCRIPVEYEEKYIQENCNFLKNFLSEVFENEQEFPLRPQSEPMSTYWPRLNSEINSWIDWGLDPINLERFICAFDEPYSGSKTYLNDVLVRIKGVALNFEDGNFHPYQSGLVYRVSKNWLCVALSGAGLIIQSLENDSGESIIEKVRVGDRFSTPNDKLAEGKNRVIYDAKGLQP